MVRKNCDKYNNREIGIIVNDYLNSNITFVELAKKYDRSVREVMRLVHKHYDMDEKKSSKRYRSYKKKDFKVLVLDDNGGRKIFNNDQEVILWFQDFGIKPNVARQLVRRALDGNGRYQNLQLTYL